MCYNYVKAQSVAKNLEMWYNWLMLKALKKALYSRTVWTLVFMVVTNVVASLTGVVSEDVLVLVNTVLAALAGYFKLSPSQKY